MILLLLTAVAQQAPLPISAVDAAMAGNAGIRGFGVREANQLWSSGEVEDSRVAKP